MHDGSQIQDEMREDASNEGDFEKRIGDSIVCGYSPPSKASFDLHRRNCELCGQRALEIGDFIQCPYCDYKSSILSFHLKKEHGVDKDEARKRGIETHSLNVRRRNGKAVSAAIMSSPIERERRAKLLGELNKTDEFRKRASETAVKTSARKDIQEWRSRNLKRWREENPDEFYNKCTKQMHKYKSKPEKDLYAYLSGRFADYGFRNNRQIKNKVFKINITNRKQIDIISRDGSIIVEFDGVYHFKDIRKSGTLKIVQEKDSELNEYALTNKVLLIRIGMSQYDYRGEGTFAQKTLDKVCEIIDNKQVGIYKLGEEYGEDNCL